MGRGSAGRRRRGHRSACAVSPEPAVRALRARGRSAARVRGGVSVLVHAGGARGGQTRAIGEQAAAALQPALPQSDRCGAGRDGGRARTGRDPLQGRARDDPLRRPHPRRGRVRQRAARRLRHRPQRRDPALSLHRRHRRRGDGDHRRRSRRGSPEQHAEAHRAHPRPRLPRASLRAHPADPQRRPFEDEQAQDPDGDHRRTARTATCRRRS